MVKIQYWKVLFIFTLYLFFVPYQTVFRDHFSWAWGLYRMLQIKSELAQCKDKSALPVVLLPNTAFT